MTPSSKCVLSRLKTRSTQSPRTPPSCPVSPLHLLLSLALLWSASAGLATPGLADVTSADDLGSLGSQPLRVHLLKLPAKYNFGLLKNKWFPGTPVTVSSQLPVPSTWTLFPKKASRNMARAAASSSRFELDLPQYPAGHIFRQHSAEYFLAVSLLTGLPDIEVVSNPADAEVIFVPFFSSVSFHISHHHKSTVKSLAKYLESTGLLRRKRGADLVVPGVHPLSLLKLWGPLPGVRQLAVDFSCPPENVANLAKDVTVPYVSAMPPQEDTLLTEEWRIRTNLLYFRGNLARKKNGDFVRKGLGRALQGEDGVVFEKGTLKWGPRATNRSAVMMHRTKFCLAPEGDTTSSCRLFDAIIAGCVPVVVADDIDPPFEEFIDYTQFAIFIPTALAHRKGYLTRLLRSIDERDWLQMHKALLKVQRHFLFSVPAKPGGAESMIWRSVAVRIRGTLKWRYRKKRLSQMVRILTEAGLSKANWVPRPRGKV